MVSDLEKYMTRTRDLLDPLCNATEIIKKKEKRTCVAEDATT